MGQAETGFGKKLPCNQKSELIFFCIEPDLVSRSSGLRAPGHQAQLLAAVRSDISIIFADNLTDRTVQ